MALTTFLPDSKIYIGAYHKYKPPVGGANSNKAFNRVMGCETNSNSSSRLLFLSKGHF